MVLDNLRDAAASHDCHAWRGRGPWHIAITTGIGSCSCGVPMLNGGRSLVEFGNLDEAEAEFYKREALLMGRSDA